MVEAGILAPIFAMMMMVNIYVDGVYETKYRSVMQARYATFSYSSNACSNSQYHPDTSDFGPAIQPGTQTNGVDSNNSGSNPPTEQPGQLPKGGNVDPGTPPGGATHDLFMAHGESTISWNYQPTYRLNDTGSNGPKVVKTEGNVLCNTPPPQGMNVFGYIANLIGGLI